MSSPSIPSTIRMSHPTLVLVHGAWHSPEHFGPLQEYLEQNGYHCVAVSLPSMIRNQGDEIPTTLSPDIEAVREAVTQELNSDSDVVVLAHSYGAVPAMSALDGLDRLSRNAGGQSTCVSGIACVAAVILPPGVTLLDAVGGKPLPLHNIKGDLLYINEPGPIHLFYHDLPPEEATKWSQLLKPQAWAVYKDKARSAAYEVIPTTYLVCMNDAALPVEAQKGIVAAASARGLPITTEEIDAGHSPYLSMVEGTGKFIRRSAGEKI